MARDAQLTADFELAVLYKRTRPFLRVSVTLSTVGLHVFCNESFVAERGRLRRFGQLGICGPIAICSEYKLRSRFEFPPNQADPSILSEAVLAKRDGHEPSLITRAAVAAAASSEDATLDEDTRRID